MLESAEIVFSSTRSVEQLDEMMLDEELETE